MIFQEYAEKLVSVDEVFNEIRDKELKDRVAAFPVPIKFLQPAPESVKFSKYFIWLYLNLWFVI